MPDKPENPDKPEAPHKPETPNKLGTLRAQTLRLDKWLWFARFCKTRTLATNLCRSGRIRVNKTPTEKPNHQIRPDDVLTFPQGDRVRIVKIVGLGARRGPASEASLLYDDMTPPPDEYRVAPKVAPRLRGAGRPTKRDRRSLDRLRGGTPPRDPPL